MDIQTSLTLPKEIESYLRVALKNNNAFLLEGEPGTGKTTLGLELGRAAQEQGGGFLFAQANAWASHEDLIQGVNLAGFVTRDPSQVWEAGLLLRAARQASDVLPHPFVTIVDEWDKTRPTADGLLLAALQERVVVDAAGHLHARIPDNLIFWITSNASRELHDALLRRVVRITLPPLTGEMLKKNLQRSGAGPHLAALLTTIAAEARRDSNVRRPTLPELRRTAEMILNADDAATCRAIVTGLLGKPGTATRKRAGDDLWAAKVRDERA